MKLFKISEPPSRIIAIDLGTSNSLVSYYDGDEIKIIPDIDHPSGLIPSAVAFTPDKTFIGKAALEQPGVIKSFKRLMGKGLQDKIYSKYPINHDTSNDQMLRLNTSQGCITPVEIAAELLKYLKNITEIALKEKVSRVIITVPAQFDEAARQATKDAAKIAGLEVVRLLNEPTAAALAYGLASQAGDKILVYDLGGGTFDLSLLTFNEGVIRVLATSGDNQLGGDDFDLALLEIFTQKLHLENFSWEQAVKEANIITKHLTDYTIWSGNFLGHTSSITRKEAEEVWQDLLHKTLVILDNLLLESAINKEDITEIVLAGGATRIPIVAEILTKKLGKKPLASLDPDKVVVLGAGLQAKSLKEGGPLLVDLVPLSLGIELLGGLVEILIPKNSPIPISVKRFYTTYQDNQTGFKIKILQGEKSKVAECRALAEFSLTNLPKKPAGQVKVEIDFKVDMNGLLFVTASEAETGQSLEVEVHPSYGLTQSEIEKLIL
jgi:molecular chaperone HscA